MFLQTPQLIGIPRTLLLTLRGRADEHQRSDALFQDDLAVKWSQSLPWDEDLQKLYSPITQATWGVRAYHFDRVAERHIASHASPLVVELGAGLSTRYYRLQQDNLHWIELDLPEVTTIRHQLDVETEKHQFQSASVMDFSWMDALPVRNPEEILFISEGLLMYFEATQVQQLVYQMRSRFPGATWVMDVVGKIAKKTGKPLEKLGAPLKWFVNNEREVEAMGLSLVNIWYPYRGYPPYSQRWPLPLRLLAQLPYFRNGFLIIESKIEPLP